MLSLLVAAVALFVGSSVSAADGSSTTQAEGHHQNEQPRPAPAEGGPGEVILMAVLGAAVLTYQVRRKIKASEGNWQRIGLPPGDDPSMSAHSDPLPEREPSEAPALQVRWQ